MKINVDNLQAISYPQSKGGIITPHFSNRYSSDEKGIGLTLPIDSFRLFFKS